MKMKVKMQVILIGKYKYGYLFPTIGKRRNKCHIYIPGDLKNKNGKFEKSIYKYVTFIHQRPN